LLAPYRKYLTSAVADVRKTPSDVPGTTVMAAMYLLEFTGGVPWIHIDNGSTAYLERPSEGWPEGATGSPVRAQILTGETPDPAAIPSGCRVPSALPVPSGCRFRPRWPIAQARCAGTDPQLLSRADDDHEVACLLA
jgi:hypothetical protein